MVFETKNVSGSFQQKSVPLGVIKLLTPKEAAELMKVSLSWLAKARMRGDGPPFIKIGRSIRYSEAGLFQWMKSRQYLSTSEH
jgi:predicted DNA-binding transcriptional regulator AlpA